MGTYSIDIYGSDSFSNTHQPTKCQAQPFSPTKCLNIQQINILTICFLTNRPFW